MKNTKPGFVLLSVFLLLTVATVLVTQLYYQGSLYNAFVPVVVHREQAKQLARAGITLAINQLALCDQQITSFDESEKSGKSVQENPEERAKQLLKLLLMVQNRWQTINFQEEQDGIEGTVAFCIMCEDGKIPLNRLVDFTKKSFIDNSKKDFKGEEFFKDLFDKMKKSAKEQDLFGAFTEILKEQKFKPIDVTDLLSYKGFKEMREDVFYVPREKEQDPRQRVYLTDVFTFWNEEPTINPLVFSHSIRLLYGLSPETTLRPLEQEQVDTIAKKIDPKKIDWKKDWNTILQSIYSKDYKSLPKGLIALLSLKFEPRVFSVLCYGKVGKVGQKLLAIVARTFTEQGEVFEVKKIYWL